MRISPTPPLPRIPPPNYIHILTYLISSCRTEPKCRNGEGEQEADGIHILEMTAIKKDAWLNLDKH